MIFDIATGRLIVGNFSGGGSAAQKTFKEVTFGMDFVITNNLAGDIDYITYTDGTNTITKTFNYVGNVLTSIVLSGDIPAGILETFTLSYTSGEVSGGAYS